MSPNTVASANTLAKATAAGPRTATTHSPRVRDGLTLAALSFEAGDRLVELNVPLGLG